MERVEITETGLLLRPWRHTDAEAVHRACQDPAIQRWTRVPSPYLPEHATSFVSEIAEREWAEGSAAHFAVCDAESGELLASCGLVSIDHRLGSGEIGYWTAPWARGRSVAVRATRAVSRWAFDRLGLRRIVWQAELGNHASRLVALRAGFRVEGRLRLADPHPLSCGAAWIGSLLPADLGELPADLGGSGDTTGSGGSCPARPAGRGSGPAGRGTGPAGRGTGPAGRGTGPAGRGSGPAPVRSRPSGAMTGHRAGPGTVDARRAAVFGHPQPVLFADPVDRSGRGGGRPGSEIRLRTPEGRDIPAIVVACRDPETVRWTSIPDPYQDHDAEFFVTEHAPLRWAAAEGAVFTVADGQDGCAGTVELRLSPGDPAVGDVGVMIAPHARGRGYCAAALAAVAAWGCTSLGLARVEWRAQVGNTASRRAAERAGFVIEGTARGAIAHRGRRVDAWFGAFVPDSAETTVTPKTR